MSAKHTPGPLTCAAGYGHHGLRIDGPNGEALGHVRTFIPSGEIRHGMEVMMPWPEGQANARLFVAAPELLDALQVVVAEWTAQFERAGHMAPAWCKQARAAIAKATNREVA